MIRKTRIKQVIPCTENINMCFWNDEESEIYQVKVRYLAIVSVDGDESLCPLCETEGGFFIPVIEMGDYLGMAMDNEIYAFEKQIEVAKKKIEAARKDREWREGFAERWAIRRAEQESSEE